VLLLVRAAAHAHAHASVRPEAAPAR